MFLAGLVLLYGLVAGSYWVAGKGEVFPMFSWILFWRVPNHVTRYSLQILRVDGRDLPTPRRFGTAGIAIANPHSSKANKLIEKMAMLVKSGDRDSLPATRRFFERAYFASRRSVRYRLVESTFDPLVRWRTGHVDRQRSVATFDHDGSRP